MATPASRGARKRQLATFSILVCCLSATKCSPGLKTELFGGSSSSAAAALPRCLIVGLIVIEFTRAEQGLTSADFKGNDRIQEVSCSGEALATHTGLLSVILYTVKDERIVASANFATRECLTTHVFASCTVEESDSRKTRVTALVVDLTAGERRLFGCNVTTFTSVGKAHTVTWTVVVRRPSIACVALMDRTVHCRSLGELPSFSGCWAPACVSRYLSACPAAQAPSVCYCIPLTLLYRLCYTLLFWFRTKPVQIDIPFCSGATASARQGYPFFRTLRPAFTVLSQLTGPYSYGQMDGKKHHGSLGSWAGVNSSAQS
ncbi:hypothetical protein BaRGS_00018493 [Batillaria attramentaria]|uniref:Uncharacterized protein n=1 Tax=Batillaria attramentaria TaxID=370345 RepID=A0ABD0KU64_9CAEN